ncbi:MAG: prepilin-type N-terminal cleavage/methylation domain-containing protein [bacterium]|nr:prepilin-type N-terminal cleavage/methylation domain-containing protein [bacterium]
MKANYGLKGFTLIEVIIAVALVAIMAVAIAPPLVQNIKSGKVARAQSDANTISTAILTFYKDVGHWPMETNTTGTNASRLVGNESLGGGLIGICDGVRSVGGSRWNNTGAVNTLTSALITNRTASRGTLYTVSKNPHVTPGWNGPYLARVPLDPWGNPYIVNIRFAPESTTDNDLHNVMVISAGPNSSFETPFNPNKYNEQIGGDDIGAVFQGASRFVADTN